MKFHRFLLITFMIITSYCGTAFGNSAEHVGVAYFMFSSPPRIERYDMNSENWLTSIVFSDTPAAFTVDADGIYVAFKNRVSRFELDGSGETHLHNTPSSIQSLLTFNYILQIHFSDDVLTNVSVWIIGPLLCWSGIIEII